MRSTSRRTYRYLLLGGGRMGEAAAYDLLRAPDTALVTVADSEARRLAACRRRLAGKRVRFRFADAERPASLSGLLPSADVLVSAVPYFYNESLARQALAAGVHFCDLGGNDEIVRRELALDAEARRRGVSIVPDCGLAPGMANLLAAHLMEGFDKPHTLKIRVGGLPLAPLPPWNYQQVFSIHGLLNEYYEPVRVLRGGRIALLPPLSELERLRFQGVGSLEAFLTSGGASTLPETYRGRLRNLDYKTIRFPGHCAVLKTLRRLGFTRTGKSAPAASPRALLGETLKLVLPEGAPDQVLVRIDAEGSRGGRRLRRRLELRDLRDQRTGFSAMMRTTGFPLAIVARMLALGQVRRRGAIPQERSLDPGRFFQACLARGFKIRIREGPLPTRRSSG